MRTKIFYLLIVILVLVFAPRLGTLVADNLSSFFISIDPDQRFMWGIIHHIVQAIIPILVVLIWKKEIFKKWGLSWGDYKVGWQWVFWFSLVWIVVYTGLTVYNITFSINPEVYYDVTNFRNLSGELLFRGAIVGPSEEILFRAFPISVLVFASFNNKYNIFNQEINQAGIISAVFFALAHIRVNITTFEIYHFNIIQIITAVGFGLMYAIIFQKTKSIFYPMFIHSISDFIPVLSLFVTKLL
ncbi:CPBP family intramembrane glutamic endopeptidase [Flavobacteriaceae bacterium 14752]|uniref:CPBP family intramembrane glutamic endopeptidase n=1 Tax=Mesohalobacter salilacus TaxID=2491711 RepID=UPI000F6448F6|nr:CPBP family intramembrane metalloprotease [Flavobacteriaceae bacterium 14752]